MTSNPGVSSECHQHHLLSHDQASMKQGTVRSRCSRGADGCFIMKSTSRQCDVMLPKLWLCKRRNTGAANGLCRFQAAEGWTRALWYVCPIPFRKDDLNGSRSHCELLCMSHWPSAAPRSEISHPRPAQFTHPKRSTRLRSAKLF